MIPITRCPIPGFFITGTGTDVGKTIVTAALAAAFHRLGARVGLCKPVASGCPRIAGRGGDAGTGDDDLVAIDSLLAAASAGLDVAEAAVLRHLSPVRFAAAVSPHIAAHLEGRPTGWSSHCCGF